MKLLCPSSPQSFSPVPTCFFPSLQISFISHLLPAASHTAFLPSTSTSTSLSLSHFTPSNFSPHFLSSSLSHHFHTCFTSYCPPLYIFFLFFPTTPLPFSYTPPFRKASHHLCPILRLSHPHFCPSVFIISLYCFSPSPFPPSLSSSFSFSPPICPCTSHCRFLSFHVLPPSMCLSIYFPYSSLLSISFTRCLHSSIYRLLRPLPQFPLSGAEFPLLLPSFLPPVHIPTTQGDKNHGISHLPSLVFTVYRKQP